MFGNVKMLGQISSLMKNREKLRESADKLADQLGALRVTGEAGGGAVKVTASGKMRVVKVELSPGLAKGMAGGGANQERAEVLIAEATNEAIEAAQKRAGEMLEKEMHELGLGDLGSQIGGMIGGGVDEGLRGIGKLI